MAEPKSSVLLAKGFRFEASRFDDDGWNVVFGDDRVGYVRRRGIKTWAGVELFVRGAALNLHGIVI